MLQILLLLQQQQHWNNTEQQPKRPIKRRRTWTASSHSQSARQKESYIAFCYFLAIRHTERASEALKTLRPSRAPRQLHSGYQTCQRRLHIAKFTVHKRKRERQKKTRTPAGKGLKGRAKRKSQTKKGQIRGPG